MSDLFGRSCASLPKLKTSIWSEKYHFKSKQLEIRIISLSRRKGESLAISRPAAQASVSPQLHARPQAKQNDPSQVASQIDKDLGHPSHHSNLISRPCRPRKTNACASADRSTAAEHAGPSIRHRRRSGRSPRAWRAPRCSLMCWGGQWSRGQDEEMARWCAGECRRAGGFAGTAVTTAEQAGRRLNLLPAGLAETVFAQLLTRIDRNHADL